MQVPLDKIRPDPKQPRKAFDSEALRLLGESLKKKQLQPVLLLADTEGFTIICGERRVQAAKLVGMTHIWAEVVDKAPSETELRVWQLTENCHRSDLNAGEIFLSVSEILSTNPSWTRADLAKHLNFSPARITQILAPLACIEAVQKALIDGLITSMQAYELSKAAKENQEGLLNLLLSKEEIKPRQASSARTARVKFPAPNATVTVAGESIDLAEYTQALEAALSAARKATKGNLDIRTAERVWRDKAGA
jgi:ParB family transcriptional regulator, chromosome partitioning protein